MDEIEAQLNDFLKDYRHFHFNRDELDGDEQRDFEERSTVALDTFRAMFGLRLGNIQFLVDDEEESVRDTLQSWARELAPSINKERQVVTTLAECSDRLMRLTSEHDPSEPAMWPYIRKIRCVVSLAATL